MLLAGILRSHTFCGEGLGFGVSGLRVQGLGFGVEGFGFRGRTCGGRVQWLRFRGVGS